MSTVTASIEVVAKNSQFPFMGSLLSPYVNHFPYEAPTLYSHEARTHLKLPWARYQTTMNSCCAPETV